MTYVSCTKDLQVSLLADRISQCIDSWTPPAIRGRDGHCGSRKNDLLWQVRESLQWHRTETY